MDTVEPVLCPHCDQFNHKSIHGRMGCTGASYHNLGVRWPCEHCGKDIYASKNTNVWFENVRKTGRV